MSSFNANTPQLKAVKNLLDAVTSLELGKVASLLSKNYQYEAFNGVTDLAKMDRERYGEMVQLFFTGITKLDVSIR
jgi:hypothetical protein